jgi:hypothetical protein
MATTKPRAAKSARRPTDERRPQETKSVARRKYRRPIERVKRPAETTTLGAGILAAVVSGLGFDGAGVDTTTWLTAAVGIVPFAVSYVVDLGRERKEDRELRVELSERAVLALESLTTLDIRSARDDDDDSSVGGDDGADSRAHDLLDLLLDEARSPRAAVKARKDAGDADGKAVRRKPEPAPKAPARARLRNDREP